MTRTRQTMITIQQSTKTNSCRSFFISIISSYAYYSLLLLLSFASLLACVQFCTSLSLWQMQNFFIYFVLYFQRWMIVMAIVFEFCYHHNLCCWDWQWILTVKEQRCTALDLKQVYFLSQLMQPIKIFFISNTLQEQNEASITRIVYWNKLTPSDDPSWYALFLMR